jgi:hypothetical protein
MRYHCKTRRLGWPTVRYAHSADDGDAAVVSQLLDLVEACACVGAQRRIVRVGFQVVEALTGSPHSINANESLNWWERQRLCERRVTLVCIPPVPGRGRVFFCRGFTRAEV